MIALFLGIVATVIVGSAVVQVEAPMDLPQDQVRLPMKQVAGGLTSTPAQIVPFSEFKFRYIVHQAYDYSCGSAALTTILHHHLGYNISEGEAIEGMMRYGQYEAIQKRRGFSLLDMKRYVATLGSEAMGFRGKISDLSDIDRPAIVPIEYAGFKHFVVVRGVRGDHVFIADPAMGHLVFNLDAFARLWADKNTLFVIYPSKDRPVKRSRLALADKELALIGADMLSDRALYRPNDRIDALQRAVQEVQPVRTDTNSTFTFRRN